MKKRLILTACLAFAMGLGVAVGAHHASSPVRSTDALAAGDEIYLEPNSNWKEANARFAVYTWKGEDQNITWTDMTAVAGTNYYKATLPANAEKAILCRMNPGSAANNWDNKWNQTSNLTLSESDGNIYSINDGAWDYSGHWDGGTYNPSDKPAEEGYYIVGTKSSWSFTGATKMTTCSSGDNYAELLNYSTATAGEIFKVRSYFNNISRWHGDNTTIDKTEAKNVYLSKDGNIYVSKYVPPVRTPGYYLIGSFNSWKEDLTGAVIMTSVGDVCSISSTSLAAGTTFKAVWIDDYDQIHYLNQKAETPLNTNPFADASYPISLDGDNNVAVTNAGNYKIVVNHGEGTMMCKYTVVALDAVTPTFTMQVVGEVGSTTLVQNEENMAEFLLPAADTFNPEDQVKFFKDGVVLEVSPKEDAQLTKVFIADEHNQVLEFAQEFQGKLVLNGVNGAVWAGQFTPGYYLAGVGGEWNPKLAIPAVKEAEGTAYAVEGIALAANSEFKFIEAPSDSHEFLWINADGSRLTVEGEAVGAEVLADGNIKVARASTYDLYYDPEGGSGLGWHSIVDKVPVVHVYTVKVGTTTYNTKLNEGTEWMIDATDIPLTAGQSVAVYKDGALDSSFERKAVGNNNLDADGKVIANSSAAQVYFDLSAKTLFVGGLGEVGGYHLLVNNNLVNMTENTDPLDPSFQEYYSELISFKTNDTVKFLDKSGNAEDHCAHTFVITKFNEGCEPAGTFSTAQAETQGVLVALQDVDLKIYLKLKTGEDEIYYNTVAPEVAEARDWAKGFTDSIGGVCKWDNTTDEEALRTAWQAKVTSYGLLDVKVQNVLKAATDKDSINELKAFVLMYNYVAGKYGDKLGEGYNFLGKTLSAPLNPAVDYTLASSDNNIMIIVIASAVALSMAMVTLIIIKKKKFSK